jgi:hypothetical protein
MRGSEGRRICYSITTRFLVLRMSIQPSRNASRHKIFLQSLGVKSFRKSTALVYGEATIDSSTVEAVCPCGKYSTIDSQPRVTCLQQADYVYFNCSRFSSVEVRAGTEKNLIVSLFFLQFAVQALRTAFAQKHKVNSKCSTR